MAIDASLKRELQQHGCVIDTSDTITASADCKAISTVDRLSDVLKANGMDAENRIRVMRGVQRHWAGLPA